MQLSLKALLLAAALAVACADEAPRLRGLQDPAAPAPMSFAGEVNAQIAQIRAGLQLAALTESPLLANSSMAAAKAYAAMTETHTLVRNNDLALQQAKAANYTGLVVKEFVTKVQCGAKTRADCAAMVVKRWQTDPDIAFAAAYDPAMKDIGTAVDDTTDNSLVFVTHVGKPRP